MKKSWRCAVPPAATAFLLALSFLFLLPARPAASQEEGAGPAPPPRTPPPEPSGGVLVSGHPRATRVGTAALLGGGNAFDAGIAAAMALAALQEGGAGWGGAAPLVLYSARDAEAMSRTGVGPLPAGATPERLAAAGAGTLAEAVVPADLDVWLEILARYGTRSFCDTVQGALQIAEGDLAGQGDPGVDPALGRLIRRLGEEEMAALAAGASRREALRAVRELFYRGEPALAADELLRGREDGLLRYEDLAGYSGKWLPPLRTRFRGCLIEVPEGWSQGPALILMLNMLDGFDLRSMGHNSAAYIHLLSQVIGLAGSDYRRWTGDPDSAPTPSALYSKGYARERVRLIDPGLAFGSPPPWGDPLRMQARGDGAPLDPLPADAAPAGGEAILGVQEAAARDAGTAESGDPGSFLCALDGSGNLLAITLPGGSGESIPVPGWGFRVGGAPGRPDPDERLADPLVPGRRPQIPGAPLVALEQGRPFLAVSAAADGQVQDLLQVLLNLVEWRMGAREAAGQPRFAAAGAARLELDGRIPPEVGSGLEALGYLIEVPPSGNGSRGGPGVVRRDPVSGELEAAGGPAAAAGEAPPQAEAPPLEAGGA